MLAAAVSMPIWGPGSDRWGRRRTYLVGIVAFTVGSGLCAIARTMMEFIGARAIQGIGAGAIATLPFVLLGVVYPPNKPGRALAGGRGGGGGVGGRAGGVGRGPLDLLGVCVWPSCVSGSVFLFQRRQAEQ